MVSLVYDHSNLCHADLPLAALQPLVERETTLLKTITT